MSIKTNYNFKGIEIENAIIRIIRIFGSSKEGWNSLVGIYSTTKDAENLIEEFNHKVEYNENENVYETIYNSLTVKYGGIKI